MRTFRMVRLLRIARVFRVLRGPQETGSIGLRFDGVPRVCRFVGLREGTGFRFGFSPFREMVSLPSCAMEFAFLLDGGLVECLWNLFFFVCVEGGGGGGGINLATLDPKI